MNHVSAIVLASMFAFTSATALAADPPQEPAKEAAAAKKALEKPANVTADAWAKMSDAEKAKAVEAAAKSGKKEKKGGC